MTELLKILSLIIGIFQLTSGFGQNTGVDTVFVKRTIGDNEFKMDTLFIKAGISYTQVLAGTSFLPYSDKMIRLLNNGLSPISLVLTQSCDDSIGPESFNDYPIFKEVKRDAMTLTIEASVIANCCHNFLGEAEVIGADTLNLIYTSYGGFCSCNCCFTLQYKFDTTMEESYNVLKVVTINGSKVVGQIPEKE